MHDIELLLWIAEKSAFGKISITTSAAAKELSISQQSASRLLAGIQEKGLIERQAKISGTDIRITAKGRDFLQNYHSRLASVLERKAKLAGTLLTGSGEGKFYITQPGYKKQFIEKLNIDPFPGTLNLRVDQNMLQQYLSSKKPIAISGFNTNKRTFGSLRAYFVRIGRIPAALIIPERTHHSNDIIELISEKGLRKALNLKDGSKVLVE
jgi:riboflavin kinase, archaea type